MYLHKDGVNLRKLHQGDLTQLTQLKDESWWGTHNTLIKNEEDQLNWYKNIPTNELYMIGEYTEKSMGIACFTNIDWLSRTLSISGSVYKEYRNLNVAKVGFAAGLDFAFEVLNMHRVDAEVLETNPIGQYLEIDYLKFRIEGRRRRAVYKSGKYYDSILLGLLREEWEDQERIKAYGDSCNYNFDHKKAQEYINRFNSKISI